MPTLFQIGDSLTALDNLLAECGGEITDAEAEAAIDEWLAETNTMLETKVDGYAALIREYESRSEAREVEARRLMALAGSDGNNAKRLKARLKSFFEAHGIAKLETPRFRVSIQANGGFLPLIVPPAWERDAAEAPEAFQKRVIELDKKAIREAIRNDEETYGAALGEPGTHLRIK
jgi:hypothetical protein